MTAPLAPPNPRLPVMQPERSEVRVWLEQNGFRQHTDPLGERWEPKITPPRRWWQLWRIYR